MNDSHQALSEALDVFRAGHMVFIHDSTQPERGSVLVAAADRVNDDIVNVMATFARGIVAVGMLPERAERLGLELQGPSANDLDRENYTVSVEAKVGVSTGISAGDRARTIQVLAQRAAKDDDLVFPGHIFPAIAEPDGLLRREGWAEAAVDLARIAGLQPVVAFCHVLDDDGELADETFIQKMGDKYDVPLVCISALKARRRAMEVFVTQINQATLPTRHGDFLCRVFVNRLDGRQHMVLSVGDVRTPEPVLVRLHSECLTGDVFTSLRCDCGPQLSRAMQEIQEEGRGAILYLRQEGRGIGLLGKMSAYALQDQGRDTVEANLDLGFAADERDFTIGAQMLAAVGIRKVRLLTNNPRKVEEVGTCGVEVTERCPIEIAPGDTNAAYLATKKEKFGHLLDLV